MSDVRVSRVFRACGLFVAGVCCLAGAGQLAMAQPINDPFASAEVISGVSGNVAGTTQGATSEIGEPRHAGVAGGASVWYRWTCPSDGLFTFRTFTANPFNPDTVLGIYTGSAVDSLTEIGSNDDGPGLGFQSLVTFNALVGEDYLIAVDGFGGFGSPSTGSFGLSWFEGAPPPPPVPGIAGEFNFSSSFYFATEYETFQAGLNNPVNPGTITSGRNRSVRGAIITVTRTTGSAGRVLVDCSTVDTNTGPTVTCGDTNSNVAIPFCDYTPTSVTLAFDEFQMSRSFVIPVSSDFAASFNRMVNIILSNPRPAPEEEFQNPGVIAPILGARTNSTLTIIEIQPQLSVVGTNISNLRTNFNIERRRYAVDEGAGSITVDVLLTGIGGSGSVEVHVVGSDERNRATWNLQAGSDFAHPANVSFPNPPYTDGNTNFQHTADFTGSVTTLAFAANEHRRSVVIPIADDLVKEFNEDIMVYLISRGNNPPVGPNGVAFVTILDDEQTAGALDRDWNPDSVSFTTPRFNSTPGANGTVRAVAVQADQRTIIGGDFTAYNSFPRNRIARINPDGSHDAGFGQNTGADSYVSSLAIYPTIGSFNDGKIVVGGGFTSFNNTPRRRIARLNSDGSLDETFLPGVAANGPVRSVAVQSDGKVLIAGEFTEFNGVARNGFARLNVNGSLDTGFDPGVGADETVWSIAVRDGSQNIFVPRAAEGTELEDVNEIETGATQGTLTIDYDFLNIEDNIRVYYDGVRIRDLTTNGIGQLSVNFGPGPSTKVTVIVNQGTGLSGTLWRYTANISIPFVERKIYIGGEFLEVDGQVRSGVARINDDGSVDQSFDPGGGVIGAVYVVAPQADGRLLIGGSFSTVDFRTRYGLARLSLDGSLDPSHNPGGGANDSVYTIAFQPDGKALVGGLFTSFNQTRRIGLTRLFVNGTVDTSFLDTGYNQFAGIINPFNFQTPNYVNSIAVQTNGHVMIGGSFSAAGGNWVSGLTNVNQTALFGTTYTVFTRSDKRPRSNVARLVGGYTPGPGNMEFVFPQNSIDENAGTLSVALRRIDGYLGSVRVTAGTTNGLASTNDFSGTIGTLFWNESAFAFRPISFGSVTERYFSIPIFDDQLIEGDELFQLGLISPLGSITLGGETIPLGGALGVPTSRVSITDNDRSKGSFAFSAPDYSFVETSGVARITVVRTNGSSDPVSVRYATTNGTALAGPGLDYTAVTGTLSFDSGETIQHFDVPLNNDLSVENDETFTVTLFSPTGGATIIPGGTATSTVSSVVMIIDNDRLSGKANFASPTFATNEGSGLARVTLVRLGGSVGQLTVNVSATDGFPTGATGGIDYTALTTNVTWVHNDTAPKTFLVPLTDDPTVEGDETVALQLSSPSPVGATGAVNTATLTIVDDDFPGTFSFSQAIYDVDERGTNVTITVVRSGGIGGTVNVDYSVVDGTAQNGTHFSVAPGTLTFDPGITAMTFSIAVIDNTLIDPDYRTATLNLNVNAPGSPGVLTSATLRIIDDESVGDPAGTLDSSFNIQAGANDAVNAVSLQPDGGILVAGAFRTMNRVTRNRVARLDTNGVLDVTFNAGQGPNQPVRAMALQPDGRIVIGGLFDKVHSTNRNYIARLLADGSLDALFNPGAGADNPVFAISLLPDGGIVIGGSFSSVNGISRRGIAVLSPDGTVRESFNPGLGADGTVLATAVQNDGKILIGGEFSTVQGVSSRRIARLHEDGSIDLGFDTGLAPNAAVRAIAVQADGKILIGGSFTTVDGAARGRMARLLSDGTLDPFYQAALDGADGDVLSIALQFDGRALVAGEFTHFNTVSRGRITRLLPNGKTDPTINFGTGASDTINALAIQTDRRILIGGRFTSYSGESRRYLARIHGGSIAGNGTLQFSAPYIDVAEAALQVTVTVERHGGTAGDVTVDYASIAGSATAGLDYTDVAGALTFVEGEVRQSFTIAVVNDSIGELPEDVILFLSNPTGDAGLGDVPIALLTILSDDSQVGFSSVSYSEIENVVGGNLLVTVVRTGATNGEVRVNYATTSGSASTGADYSPVSGVLTFVPGQTTQTFSVPILDDTLIEPDETFGLLLSNVIGSATVGQGTSTVTIVDNDFRAGNLTFSAPAYSVSEGAGSVFISVLRTNGTTGVLTVGYVTAGGTALADVDYVSASGTLSFIEGQTSATIVVPIINDTEVEGDEGFNVRLFNPTGGAVISSATNAVVTIQDDEFGPGSLDRSFDPGAGANGLVRSIAVQTDGKVIAGGAFTIFDGRSRNSVTRLNANGSLDLAFNPGLGANGGVSAVGATPTGNILLGGAFDRFDGQLFNRVVRLETNGLPDAGFSASSGLNAGVDALTVLADGRFYIGGAFSSPTRGICRLAAGGNVDASFGPGSGTDGRVHCAVVQPDGSVIIGGTFTTVAGEARSRVARLDSSGLLDTAFATGAVTNGTVLCAAIQADGRIVVGGDFVVTGSTNRVRIARLNTDGTLDSTFDPGTGANGAVYGIGIQSTGRIILGGDFTSINATSRGRFARLLSNGSLDLSFDPGRGANATVYSVIVLANDDILLGGAFSQISGTPRGGVARILGGGGAGLAFAGASVEGGVARFSISVRPGWDYVLEASADLVHWNPVTTHQATSAIWQFSEPVVAGAKFFRVRQLAQ